MKFGILVSMINNFGQKGFYNSQEIGLAKALAKLGNNVTVYKLIAKNSEIPVMETETNYKIVYRKTKSLGINGFVDVNLLDKSLDALVFFADTQLSVPKVDMWCRKNNVKLLPYIGVMESHSSNFVIRNVINALFVRNILVFKRTICLAKNTDVAEKLQAKGVKQIVATPVGLDMDLLNNNYSESNKEELLMKHGFEKSDRVILFIGRLEDEKRPIELVDIFEQLRDEDKKYKLLMIGKGKLKTELIRKTNESRYKNEIIYIESIPNNEVWELYRLCDCFVNLNQQEIFGMVILEAMFYETKVVAWRAPGPELIIENGISGYLVSSVEDMKKAIRKNAFIGKEAHMRVVNNFTWNSTASKIASLTEVGGGGYYTLTSTLSMQPEFEVAA